MSDGPMFGTSIKPLSPKQKTQMHLLWRTKPEENTPATLSRRFGVGIERVNAILRSKQTEEVRIKEGDRWKDDIEKLVWGQIEEETHAPRREGAEEAESKGVLMQSKFVVTNEEVGSEAVVALLEKLSSKKAKVHTVVEEEAPLVEEEVGSVAQQPNARWNFVFKSTKDESTFAKRDKGEGGFKAVTGGSNRYTNRTMGRRKL